MAGEKEREEDDHKSTHSGWPLEVYDKMKEGHDSYMNSPERVVRPDSNPQDRVDPNPFIAFKDFIDTQFNTLADSFRSFPDNLTELRRQMEREREQRQNEQALHFKNWTHVEHESPDHFEMRVDRASKAQRESALGDALSAISISNRENVNVSQDKIHALYRDESFPSNPFALFSTPLISPHGACENMYESGNNGHQQIASGNATFWRWPPVQPSWLSVDWFKHSEYSPTQLESQDSDTRAIDVKWRAAFEDLLDASLEKPISDSTDKADSQQRSSPGLQWLLSLHRRGTLPPHLPTIHRLFSYASDAQQTVNQLVVDYTRNGLPQSIPIACFADMKELIDAHLAAQLLGFTDATIRDHNKHDDNDHRRETSTSAVASQTPKYQDLLARGKALSGEDFSRHHLSFSELFDMIERMEQESRALDLDHVPSSNVTPPMNPKTGLQESDKSPRLDTVDVLSSLTTTHTTRLPDGTVTTKIVLKQRFADGREETQQKVHTYTDGSSTRIQNSEDGQGVDADRTSKAPAKPSWFWK